VVPELLELLPLLELMLPLLELLLDVLAPLLELVLLVLPPDVLLPLVEPPLDVVASAPPSESIIPKVVPELPLHPAGSKAAKSKAAHASYELFFIRETSARRHLNETRSPLARARVWACARSCPRDRLGAR
jgi:hypothetical protein